METEKQIFVIGQSFVSMDLIDKDGTYETEEVSKPFSQALGYIKTAGTEVTGTLGELVESVISEVEQRTGGKQWSVEVKTQIGVGPNCARIAAEVVVKINNSDSKT